MPLTEAETSRLRTLLKAGPLSAASPTLVSDMAAAFQSSTYPANQIIYDTGMPGGMLFLLVEGSVTQTMGSSGQPWYQKDLAPGDFFGQRSLLSGQHETRAVASSPVTVYTMPALAVTPLLDRYPDLREVLWRDGLASRLRSIALFQNLSDSEISWLTELIEVVAATAGSELPIDAKPGLWIVNWGQVEVAGPAAYLPSAPASAAGSEPTWVLTAGNFFFTLQQGAHFGGNCAARWARTVRNSQLLFLDEHHFNQLLAALPAVRPLIDRPLDIPAALQGIPLFNGPGMTDAHRRQLAQICAWGWVPANQNISAQGTVGYSFVHMLRGGAIVTAVDDKGRSRPVSIKQPGESYGSTSLLESTRRDATVRAVQGRGAAVRGAPGQSAAAGAEILNLDRRDLQVAFAERPDLWKEGVALYDKYLQVKAERPRYPWLAEGENVLWADRRYIGWLVVPLLLQTLVLVALMAAIDFVLREAGAGWPAIGVTDVMLFLLVFMPILVYTIWNYRDDYYALTNRRVTRHDREPFASDARIEAPLEMVQDVTYKSGLWGRVLDYGDVTVRTAAKVGSLVFDHVPHPDTVVKNIQAAKAGAAVAVRGSTKESLRRGLISDLRLALAVPDLDSLRALGDNVQPEVRRNRWQRVVQTISGQNKRPRVLPVTAPPRQSPLRRLLAPLPERWRNILLGPPPRPPRPITGEVVWQKHWVNLAQRGGAALLLLIVLVIAGLFMIIVGEQVLDGTFVEVFLVWLVLFVSAAGWFWYHVVDWRNDLYIVTDDRIIDVEQKPLALSLTQRESSLDAIQTVQYQQNSVWAKMLNYGDVVIRTAAADEGFTFQMVPSPMLVQKTISQKLDAFRRGLENKRIDERRRDVAEGLQVYHELSQNAQRRGP